MWLWLRRKILFPCSNARDFPAKFYIHLHHYIINCFLSQLGYWSDFYQLHVLILKHRIHDIMIFGRMNDKLPSKSSFWKWIPCGRRKWWKGYSKLSRKIAIEKQITITCKKVNISSWDEISSRLADPEFKLSSRDETSFFSM